MKNPQLQELRGHCIAAKMTDDTPKQAIMEKDNEIENLPKVGDEFKMETCNEEVSDNEGTIHRLYDDTAEQVVMEKDDDNEIENLPKAGDEFKMETFSEDPNNNEGTIHIDEEHANNDKEIIV